MFLFPKAPGFEKGESSVKKEVMPFPLALRSWVEFPCRDNSPSMKTTRIPQYLLSKIVLTAIAIIAASPLLRAQTFTMNQFNAAAVFSDSEFNRILGDGSMFFSGPGAYTAILNMPAGTYHVSSTRWAREDTNFSFNLSVDGVQRIEDFAVNPTGGMSEEILTIDYLGYITSDGSPMTVLLNLAGADGGRVQSVDFVLTEDVYFDENTPGLILENVDDLILDYNSTPWGSTTTLKNDAGVNGKMIKASSGPTPGSMSGTIMLEAGQTYAVYASRQVHDTDVAQISYDVALNFNYFATISGQAFHVEPDAVEETYLGQFTAANALTNVMLSNAGQYYGRHDYLRFVAVPEPSRVALLSIAGLAGLFFRRRNIGLNRRKNRPTHALPDLG